MAWIVIIIVLMLFFLLCFAVKLACWNIYKAENIGSTLGVTSPTCNNIDALRIIDAMLESELLRQFNTPIKNSSNFQEKKYWPRRNRMVS